MRTCDFYDVKAMSKGGIIMVGKERGVGRCTLVGRPGLGRDHGLCEMHSPSETPCTDVSDIRLLYESPT
jgi:hypothetical protein